MAVTCSECGKSMRSSTARADHYVKAHPKTKYGKKMAAEQEAHKKRGGGRNVT